MKNFLSYLSAGLRAILALTVLLGVVYPLTIWAAGQLVARDQASGSLVVIDGRPVGSRLIGQSFSDPQWLWPRPSAKDHDAMASGASNLGPNSDELTATIQERKAAVAAAHGIDPAVVPADAVTASASGLDPDISPEYARLQIGRIAAARGVGEVEVRAVVDRHTRGRLLGILGEPTVNVLEVNIELAQLGQPR